MLYFDVLAVISTVVSRSEINCSQFDPQTFTWFGYSVVDSSRTLSYLVRRLRCKTGAQESCVVPVVLNSSSLFSSTWSNFLGQWYEVLLRRTPLNIRPRRFARLHDLSTMSNSIDQVVSPMTTSTTVRSPLRATTVPVPDVYVDESNRRTHRQPSTDNRQPSTVNHQPSTINRQHCCRTVKL